MSHEIDLKTIEKKAYLSYHQDGLMGLFVGLGILGFGIGMAADATSYLGGLLPAILFSLWAAAKKAITVPRVGLVRFGPERRIRIKKEKRFFMIFFTITMLAGVGVFFVYEGRAGLPSNLRSWLSEFVMAPMGLIGAISFCVLAYWKQITRYYIYAALLLVAVFVGPLLDISPPVYVSAAGGVILLCGLAMLIRFLRSYPLVTEEVSLDGH